MFVFITFMCLLRISIVLPVNLPQSIFRVLSSISFLPPALSLSITMGHIFIEDIFYHQTYSGASLSRLDQVIIPLSLPVIIVHSQNCKSTLASPFSSNLPHRLSFSVALSPIPYSLQYKIYYRLLFVSTFLLFTIFTDISTSFSLTLIVRAFLFSISFANHIHRRT